GGGMGARIAGVAEVHQFNALFKMRRARVGHDPAGLVATWANIAFSSPGLTALTSQANADGVPDNAFRAGLPAQAGTLGDPTPPRPTDPPPGRVFGGARRRAARPRGRA